MKKIAILAHATSGLANRGTRAERTRPGQANSFNPDLPAPRPGETQSQYMRRTNQSINGATARTRGTPARIQRPRGNNR